MTTNTTLILVISFIAANLPWVSEKFFFFFSTPTGSEKKVWMRLLEWFVLGVLALIFSIGLEQKTLGDIHSQEWEFYAIFASLFVVFAFPSFIYRHLVIPLRHRKSL